jgi:hypothetical protein
MCHSLSDESTYAATMLGSCARIPGLVVAEELVSNICYNELRWQTAIDDDNVVRVDQHVNAHQVHRLTQLGSGSDWNTYPWWM